MRFLIVSVFAAVFISLMAVSIGSCGHIWPFKKTKKEILATKNDCCNCLRAFGQEFFMTNESYVTNPVFREYWSDILEKTGNGYCEHELSFGNKQVYIYKNKKDELDTLIHCVQFGPCEESQVRLYR